MDDRISGFRELEHTADWELEVWATDLVTLLEEAARGMYSISGTSLQVNLYLTRELEISAHDPESTLVTFLEELLYLGEVEGLGFDKFELKLIDEHLLARLGGAPIASQEKEIKAVTYHNLKVRETMRGIEVNIVFDV
jgi:SHS2 domain-containing protein